MVKAPDFALAVKLVEQALLATPERRTTAEHVLAYALVAALQEETPTRRLHDLFDHAHAELSDEEDSDAAQA